MIGMSRFYFRTMMEAEEEDREDIMMNKPDVQVV